jgi:hypothetical protein
MEACETGVREQSESDRERVEIDRERAKVEREGEGVVSCWLSVVRTIAGCGRAGAGGWFVAVGRLVVFNSS